MRNKYFLMLTVLFALFVIMSCSYFEDDDDDNNGSDISISLFEDVSNTAPVFKPDAGAVSLLTKSVTNQEWGSGNVIYSIYYTLREYKHPDDDGVVDRSNIYKTMFDIESLINGTPESLNLLSESKVLIPAFDFGHSRTYDSYFENQEQHRCLAIKETDDQKSFLLGWNWFDTGNDLKKESGVAQVIISDVQTLIDIDMIFAVDYDTETSKTDYNIRLHLNGNPITHEFEFSYRIGQLSIVAKGISQGDGNYFLFKTKGENTPDASQTYYFVIPADADEAYLENLTFEGAYTSIDEVVDSSVDTYKSYVNETPFFTDSDMLTDINNLNKDTNLQGTVYVNYKQ